MYLSVLETLICPVSRSKLELYQLETGRDSIGHATVERGLLFVPGSEHLAYPVVRGIPRMFCDAVVVFAEEMQSYLPDLPESLAVALEIRIRQGHDSLDHSFDHTRASFSAEWSRVDAKDSAWGRDPKERLQEFLTRLDVSEKEIEGKKILDAGCGHGEIELGLANFAVEIFAVDLSFSVDELRTRLDRRAIGGGAIVHLVQANLFDLPIARSSVDYVFSDGVLHHTPNTERGFESIASALREGGKCFIMVYSRDHKNAFEKALDSMIRVTRKMSSVAPHWVLDCLCWVAAPLYWLYLHLYQGLGLGKRNTRRSLSELRLSLFDSLSPMFAWNHSTEQVVGWYRELGFQEIRKTFFNHIGVGVVGTLNRALKC
jgi:SAM-dependent methyltransferase/uncharacterized protein YbaR (Trm112 family)